MAAKKPGQNIQNWQRKTEQILLRFPPEVAARPRIGQDSLMNATHNTALIEVRANATLRTLAAIQALRAKMGGK